jgi:hypothetical protein
MNGKEGINWRILHISISKTRTTYLRQGSRFIGADNRDGTQRLHRLQGLTQDLILLHQIGRDCQTCRQSYRKAHGHKSNCHADAVYN